MVIAAIPTAPPRSAPPGDTTVGRGHREADPPEPSSTRNRALDGFRGLAVLAVVVFHFAPGHLPGGYLGVDVFFVLSGCLITSGFVAERRRTGSVHLWSFWIRRARRLLPAALVTVVAVVVVGARWDEGRAATRSEVVAALTYVANWPSALGGTSYFDVLTPPSPLRHFWSLAIEEQFYVVAPVAVAIALAARRRGARWHHLIGGTAAVAMLSATALAVRYGDGSGSARAYYGTDARAFEILAGVVLALIVDRTRSSRVRRPPRSSRSPRSIVRARRLTDGTALVGLLVLAVSSRAMGSESPAFFRGGAVLVVAAAAAVIVACLRGGAVHRLLSWRPLAALGVISYGVYLYHWPIARWLDPTTVPLDGVGLFALRSSATLVAAMASFHLIERPLQRAAPSRRPDASARSGRLTVATASAVVAVFLVGACGVVASPSERSPLSGPPIAAGPATGLDAPGSTDVSAFARVVQVPPAPGPWLPIDQADALGEWFFVNTCFGGQPLVTERDNGAGDLVAVIGDSITAEIVTRLVADRSHDWMVVSLCGLALTAMDPSDRFHGELSAALDRVVASAPRAMVIAFTTSGASSTVPDVSRDLDALLARTASVPCPLVMNAHPNPEMDRAAAHAASSGLVTLNEALSARRHEHLTLLDWDASVEATPITADGYHPFLDPSDWLHLVPDQGDAARIALIRAGVDTCPV